MGPCTRGFTLLELSIVLVLISIIVGGGLASVTAYTQANQYNLTVARMEAIDKALLNFSITNTRIPCPSDLTQLTTSTTYGMEAGAGAGSAILTGTGVCQGTGMLPQANFVSTSGAYEGGVPTRALLLSDDYMYDGWGRRIRYAVDPVYTVAGTLPVAATCFLVSTPDASAITVNDSTGAARTSAGAYALVSGGANGHGAYTSGGVIMNTGSVNSGELTNCHCTSAAVSSTYTPTYVEQAPSLDPSNNLDNFDDIVTFKEAWQLQALNSPVTSVTCPVIYVVDNGNNRIEKFGSGGNYLYSIGAGYQGVSGSIGSSGTGNGQFSNVYGVATDSSGNVYAFDGGGNHGRVQKFSSAGAYISTPIAPINYGTGNGETTGISGMAMDSSGNFYLGDDVGRIQEFNSSGNWVQNIGGGASCTSCNSTSSCTCTTGSGNGLLCGYEGSVAVDASGNVYIADPNNYRVVEFNSSGTWVQNIGGTGGGNGSGNGYFSSNFGGVAVDPSGYLWVADGWNRVQKFLISGSTYTWEASLGGTSSACTSCLCTNASHCPHNSGSGNGQINNPSGISFDTSGNIYVTDSGNNRVQIFTNSGIWIASIGGPSPYTCETSPAASSPSCASGIGSGQFNSPNGIAVFSSSSR